MASSHILQIFLRVTVQDQVCIAQWGIVDEVVQLCPLHHGYIKCILQGQCNLLLHERASTNIQPYTRCRLNSLTRTLVSLNAANIIISVPLLTFLSQSWYNANVQEVVYILLRKKTLLILFVAIQKRMMKASETNHMKSLEILMNQETIN